MDECAQQPMRISGAIMTLGLILTVLAVYLGWTWLTYTGVIILIGGIAMRKFMEV